MKFLPLVLKNVFRKKTRTALTIASIVLPLLVINLMGTFLRALDRPDPGATRGMFRTVTRHKVSLGNPLPVAYFEKIRQLPGVVAATKFTWFGGKYVDQSAKNFFPRFAVEPETFLQVFDDAKIVAGSKEEWLADRTGAVVGDNLVKKFGWKLGDKVVLVGDIFPVTLELTVRGIFQLPDGNAMSVFFNRKYLEEALPSVAGQVGTVWVKAADGPAAERLTREIDAMFENAAAPTKTESEKAFQMGFVQMLGNVKLLINGIATIIVFVIFLIAANTMAMAARERVTEIAVLRTLGFEKSTILGDGPRREPPPRADRRRARDPPLRPRGAGPEGGAHAVADVRVRGVVRPLPGGPRDGTLHHGLRRPRGRARPGHPVGAAADRGGAAAGGMKYLPFVLKNLFRKKTRSILTVGSILLPLFVICILGTLLRALEADPSNGKGMYRLITRHKVSITNWLLESQGPKIRQIPGVTEIVRMNWFGGAYIDQSAKNQFARFSTSDPEALLRVFDEVSVAEGSAEEWFKDRTGALVGGVLMQKYGWKLGQKVPLKGDIYPLTLELTIRAVYKGPDETGLYFHHSYIEEALPRVKGYVGWYWIKAASPEAAAKIPGAGRRPLREFRPPDANGDGEGVPERLGLHARKRQAPPHLHRRHHRVRHPPDRREHDGDGGPGADHRDRGPPDARLPERDDPRDDPRRERPAGRLRRLPRPRPLHALLPRFPEGNPVLADGGLRRRDGGPARPAPSRRGVLRDASHRGPRRRRAGRPRRRSGRSPTASGRSDDEVPPVRPRRTCSGRRPGRASRSARSSSPSS